MTFARKMIALAACLAAAAGYGQGWFGIPEDWDEVVVERAAVVGVLFSDSVCDITGAAVVDLDAGYRARRVAPGRYVVRERAQRYFFEARGDSLLWTGYENRLMRSLGSGAFKGIVDIK